MMVDKTRSAIVCVCLLDRQDLWTINQADSKDHALSSRYMTWLSERGAAYQKWHQEENETHSVRTIYLVMHEYTCAVPDMRQKQFSSRPYIDDEA